VEKITFCELEEPDNTIEENDSDGYVHWAFLSFKFVVNTGKAFSTPFLPR